jgi:hypothetical protein
MEKKKSFQKQAREHLKFGAAVGVASGVTDALFTKSVAMKIRKVGPYQIPSPVIKRTKLGRVLAIGIGAAGLVASYRNFVDSAQGETFLNKAGRYVGSSYVYGVGAIAGGLLGRKVAGVFRKKAVQATRAAMQVPRSYKQGAPTLRAATSEKMKAASTGGRVIFRRIRGRLIPIRVKEAQLAQKMLPAPK